MTNLTENSRTEKILQASSGSSRSLWLGTFKGFPLLQNQKSRFTLKILRLWTHKPKKHLKPCQRNYVSFLTGAGQKKKLFKTFLLFSKSSLFSLWSPTFSDQSQK